MRPSYRGRFAPSPSGLLHRGSLLAAFASWLDARAHNGKWLIRIENIDPPRERPGAAQEQIRALAELGMVSDEPIVYQSARSDAYLASLHQLQNGGMTYLCSCSRSEQLAAVAGAAQRVYPGTCRGRSVSPPAAVRVRVPAGRFLFTDRALGSFEQDLAQDVGDFIVRRSDGLWAYQLAVVVDDAYQGITDVVRGADLLDNTPRQMMLQRALGLAHPRYLHVPLLCDENGKKFSKHEGAAALATGCALGELERAWQHLGFAPLGARTIGDFQHRAIARWRERWGPGAGTPAQLSAARLEQTT